MFYVWNLNMILPQFFLIFLYLGNPFAFVIFVFGAILIIYLKHHYISKPIIFNISSIYHFKTCKIKHLLLVIIVNLLENDYVNQIIDLLINKKYLWNQWIFFSNIIIWKSWRVTILPKFTIHNNLKKKFKCTKCWKKHYNKKGEELSMFLMSNYSRCLNWFICTTFFFKYI